VCEVTSSVSQGRGGCPQRLDRSLSLSPLSLSLALPSLSLLAFTHSHSQGRGGYLRRLDRCFQTSRCGWPREMRSCLALSLSLSIALSRSRSLSLSLSISSSLLSLSLSLAQSLSSLSLSLSRSRCPHRRGDPTAPPEVRRALRNAHARECRPCGTGSGPRGVRTKTEPLSWRQ